MKYEVVVESAAAELLAAVTVTAPANDVSRLWKPALDQVWAFLKTQSDLPAGKNLFLYHHPANRNDAMRIDFGVQVPRPFKPEGSVHCAVTPAGEVARTVHTGPYQRLSEAHQAIHEWCGAHHRKIAHASWEIYGHWNSNPDLLETTVKYLLTS